MDIKESLSHKKNSHTGAHGGQTLLEYIVLVSIVAAALGVMSPLFKRGIQSIVKVTADQMAPQNESEQDPESGYLVNAFTSRRETSEKIVHDVLDIKEYIFNDISNETSQSLTNLGFTNRNN